jgi:hypothetical protein
MEKGYSQSRDTEKNERLDGTSSYFFDTFIGVLLRSRNMCYVCVHVSNVVYRHDIIPVIHLNKVSLYSFNPYFRMTSCSCQ